MSLNILLIIKYGLDLKIILNTYFPKIVNSTDDIVEKILLDVDIICSMMFGHISGLILSKRLKHEIKLKKIVKNYTKVFYPY